MDNLDTRSKFCRTCNELSPAGLDKCQFCGSEISEIITDNDSDLDLNTTIGKIASEEENNISPETEIHISDEIGSYVEETQDKQNNSASSDQAQFNDIFGFKSSNLIQENEDKVRPLSNKRKVLLTVICSIVPGFGQLFCLILSVIFMNSEDDDDRKSFGTALFGASLILFVITLIISFLIAVAVYQPPV